jgi:hypothetical protein
MAGTEGLPGRSANISTNGNAILSSWKEIAGYLGKGVRTVQRWERELRLPVRRPVQRDQRIVIAVPAELDEWVRCQLPRPGGESGGVASLSNGELAKLVENIRRTYRGAQRLLNTARNLPRVEVTRRNSQRLRQQAQQTRQRSEQLRSNGQPK